MPREELEIDLDDWVKVNYNRFSGVELGIWEQLNNPDFKVVEFDHFRMQAGLPSFVLSPGNWIEKTGAIGMYVKSGRYGGTYAHKDIAFEFCSAISPIFKLYLIKEFQRLKEEEQKLIGWNLQRTLSKINYHIHTDAIKENLIPGELPKSKIGLVYATEADLLNTALKKFLTSCFPENSFPEFNCANTQVKTEVNLGIKKEIVLIYLAPTKNKKPTSNSLWQLEYEEIAECKSPENKNSQLQIAVWNHANKNVLTCP